MIMDYFLAGNDQPQTTFNLTARLAINPYLQHAHTQ